MADDFHSGICSGTWWNTGRTTARFDVSSTVESSAPSVSCSTAIPDLGAGAVGVFSESTGSSVSTTYQESLMVSGPLIDSPTMQISGFGLSSPSMDWNQPLLRSSGRPETSFHSMLQEPLNYFRQDSSIEPDQVHVGNEESSTNPFKDMNPNFLLESGFPGASYGSSCPSTMLQGLYEPEIKPQQSIFDARSVNYNQSPTIMGNNYHGSSYENSLPKFPLPKQHQSTSTQLHFSTNASFWNPTQFLNQSFEPKPSCSNLTSKSNLEGGRDSCSSGITKRSGSSEPALKKPRIETPSPLPTFKVRKEKLGDRITALQQLVSPFGKTDTASVLHEAIDYIKFLHDQVSVLSAPYLKNGHPMQHQQNSDHKSKDAEGVKQDLRSRGLCLVPIASTYPVASETTADFWTPTFGGSYR